MSSKRPKIKPSRVIYLTALFAAWIMLVASLVYETYLKGRGEVRYVSLETGMREIPSESEWMAIYHQGQKLGYAVFSVFNRDSLGYTIKSTSQMNIALAGVQTSIHLESSVFVDNLFRLDSFDFWMISDQYRTKIRGFKDGDEMNLIFYQGADSSLQTIKVPEELYTYTGIQPMVASQGIKAGETLKLPAFDPASLEMSDVEVFHAGKEMLVIEGVEYELNRLELEFRGIPSIMWLDDNGMTYREETVMGLVMERSTPSEAMRIAESSDIDLLEAYAVYAYPPIKRSHALTSLTLQLDGVVPDLFLALDSERQKVLSTDPLTLQMKPVPLIEELDNLDRYLVSTETIQSDHPLILDAASRVVAKAGPIAQRTRALNFWVYEHLAKQPVVSISSAVEILEGGIGDCSEHTTLFTAMSRAAGIPTKVNVGMVYVQGRFLYHAWPSVYVNGRWEQIDPTLGQYPADATHIALLEGDFANLTELVTVLGRVQVKVLDQKHGDSD